MNNAKLLLFLCSNILIVLHAQEKETTFKKAFLKSLSAAQTQNVPQHIALENQLPLVIVLYSHDHQDTFMHESIDSVLEQQYAHYRIIYVVDEQCESLLKQITHYKKSLLHQEKLTILPYDPSQGILSGLSTAISSCNDQEIIVLMNSCDWFAESSALSTICSAYLNNDVWFTYGSCKPDPKDVTIGIRTTAVPQEIHEKHYFREIFPFMPPVTFYAWLFKQIREEDLIDPKTKVFYEHAIECYVVWPIIEMAARHYEYIQRNIYVVNNNDPLKKLEEDYYLRMACNAQMDKQLPLYQALEKPAFSTTDTRFGIGKFWAFWNYITSFMD